MSDVGGLGVKLISVTIVTLISLEGGGVGGGNVVRGGQWGWGGVSFS